MKQKNGIAPRLQAWIEAGKLRPGCGELLDTIEAGRSHHLDSPFILAEPGQTLCTRFGRGEVDVRQLCNHVAERVVQLTQRSIAAVNVSDRNSLQVRGRGGGEVFNPIANRQNDVRLGVFVLKAEKSH